MAPGGRRGVSDVVATILLLALTVTLFASIFAFVTAFPSPPAQNNNQFQASLIVTPNGTFVSAIHILHLAGPVVAGNALVYLKSAAQPAAVEFANPYTVASEVVTGIATVTGANSWNLGQVWNITFNQYHMPAAGGNITVYVVAGSQLLFSVILPGAITATPPTIVSTATVPATPAVGVPFTVYATLAGSYTPYSVYINLAAMPGGPSTPRLMTQNSQGQWTYYVSAGATKPGTFYGFVNASSSVAAGGQQATGAVVITIAATGTVNSNLTVGVVLVPSPPNSGVWESVQAVVTYTGAPLTSAATVTVTFSGTSSPAGYTFSGSGPANVKISGASPSTVTVVSQSNWQVPNPTSLTLYTYTVTATATVATVGTNTGTTSFTPATVVVGPSSGLVGSTTTARGAGFVPSASVTLTFSGITITPSGTTNSTCTFTGSTITTTATGTFVCQFVVPNGASPGAVMMLATAAQYGQNDTAPFTVTTWTLTVGPSSGLVGSTATARGAGFGATATTGSSVTLKFDGITITPSGTSNGTCTFTGSTITTTTAGAFACQFVIPNGATAGAGTLIASDTTYPAQSASASYTVTAWSVTVGPSSGLMGSTVTARGTGFGATSTTGSSVTLTFDGITITPSGTSNGTCTFTGSTITTTTAGAFACQFVIPNGATAGTGTLIASDATYPTQTASAVYTVTTWTITLSKTSSTTTPVSEVITGTGFASGTTLSITYAGALISPTAASCTTGSSSGATITTAPSGATSFVCTFSVTLSATTGIYTFQAIDYTTGQVATASFDDLF